MCVLLLVISLFIALSKNYNCNTLQMADNGIVSRFRGNELHCNECIRVTIGLPEENAKFLELLKTTFAELTK
jgi:histidinol-phosphate/aromatic aminotransferase/cobyric acid decarboxylase-like protein